MSKGLKYFENQQAAVDYAASGILSTLRDSYDRMAGDEREHYTNDDRQEMSRKIHDVTSVASLLRNAVQGAAAIALLESFVRSFEREIEEDDDINGGEAVEYIAGFYKDCQKILRRSHGKGAQT
jgi:hypothetical protein